METKSKITTTLIGLTFVILGLLLLATIVNWIDFDSLYRTLIPLVLIAGGIGAFSSGESKNRKVGLGLGLFTVGVVALMVRFNFVSAENLSIVLGVLLLVSGVILLTKLADKWSTKKPDSNNLSK